MPSRTKQCKKCGVLLTKKNSQYPKQCVLLCNEHMMAYHMPYIKKYHSSPKGKEAVNKASRKAYQLHKEKWLARAKARYAVKIGRLIKPKKCEVCDQVKPLQGHHEDYTKPLQVIWLCSGCHAEADRFLEAAQKVMHTNNH